MGWSPECRDHRYFTHLGGYTKSVIEPQSSRPVRIPHIRVTGRDMMGRAERRLVWMTEQKLLNCTPHKITLMEGAVGQEVAFATLPPTGICPRCLTTDKVVGNVVVDGHDVPVMKTTFGEVTDLPEREEGVLLIVSLAVAKARPDRDDLLTVYKTVRDGEGQIIGATALARVY